MQTAKDEKVARDAGVPVQVVAAVANAITSGWTNLAGTYYEYEGTYRGTTLSVRDYKKPRLIRRVIDRMREIDKEASK